MEHLKQFSEHLQTALSFAQFQQLHVHLGIKPYRLTTLLTGKEDWQLVEIDKVAALLGADPLDLILQWKLGRKYLKLQDVEGLLLERGLEISFVEVA